MYYQKKDRQKTQECSARNRSCTVANRADKLPYHVVNSSSSSVFRIIGDQLSISRSIIIHKPPSKRKIQPLRQLISEVKSIWTLCFSSPPITFTMGCHHIARKWFRIHHCVISYTVVALVVSKTRDSWLYRISTNYDKGLLVQLKLDFEKFQVGLGTWRFEKSDFLLRFFSVWDGCYVGWCVRRLLCEWQESASIKSI